MRAPQARLKITFRLPVRVSSTPISPTCVWTTRSASLHLFGRYTFFGGISPARPILERQAGPASVQADLRERTHSTIRALHPGGDYIVSPSWLTDFRFGYYRIYNDTAGPEANQPLGNQLGIPNANVGNPALTGGMPQFNIDIPANGANGGQNIEYGTSAAESLQQTSQYQLIR